MFGCDGWFANGEIYALVWKDGRVGVRLPDETMFAALLARPGADRWTPGGKMTMRYWVLVPRSFHDDVDELRAWMVRAHAAARSIKAARAAKRPKKASR
jgi:TfoX/Sxy family transcriptional regulator of competence genes